MSKFYLGMDVGTNSVGMACTDENYKLLRAKGKDCWATRLFDESSTAKERRTKRTARRRLERRKYRISLLQGLFAPVISDKTFFIRLNNSQFVEKDKDALLLGDDNSLFADEGYADKDFHKEFPTAYHLRKALMSGKKYDLRLYYLAIHHIVKYRGHFLVPGGMSEVRDAKRLFISLNEALSDFYGEDACLFDESLSDKARDILTGEGGVKDKTKRLNELFGNSDKISKEIYKGVCGASVSPKVLFGEDFAEEKSVSFKKLGDEEFGALASVFGDGFSVLSAIRGIYDFAAFEKLLAGYPDISSAMIAIYDKHKADLKKLKYFIKNDIAGDSAAEYRKIFKSTEEKGNYVAYVGYTKKGGEKKKVEKCSDEEFYAYLKKFFVAIKDGGRLKEGEETEKRYAEIFAEIENATFLPKILHSDNGLFPRQVNEDELVKIVAAMTANYPETAEFAGKIKPLFEFRVPYFVGPLNVKSKNAWVVRTDEKITPWNFGEVVDEAASVEAFMRKMTNKCSYLRGEDVLPKNSVLYQRFNVLNQLNNLKVNGVPLSVPIKQKIYDELFTAYAKVSDKKIIEFLVREGKLSAEEAKNASITGKDGEFNASLSSYIKFVKILGDFAKEDVKNGGGVVEKIILWHTLNTDKSIVEELIKKNFGNIPVIMQNLKTLKGLSFKDFGRLSEKFLTGIFATDAETGARLSVMDCLYQTNENLNQILFNEKYGFLKLVRQENGEDIDGEGNEREITYEDVEELYVSPAVRRGIWQSLLMADEYVKAIGKVPDKIFVEMSREDGVKGDAGRKQSRKKALLEKYKSLTESEGFSEIIKELSREDITDMTLRREKLYLYFRQLGRCMYTGKKIDLEDLLSGDAKRSVTYDVDHILPRSYEKDDSIDNKVLVLREKNAEKADVYPLPEGFTNQKPFWKFLLAKGLLKKTTYDRLTRTEPLGEDDYNGFISRQKVITDQTAKALAELLKRKYPTAKVVYSKAKNVSDFKNRYELFKCRETNDFHHARDAYLNIVVGNVYDVCFTPPMSEFYMKEDGWRRRNLDKLFDKPIRGAWNEDSLAFVKNTFARKSMQVTRYAFCNKGAFYNETVLKRGESGITAPRKGNGPLADASQYGGYTSQNTAYFTVVESKGKKGKLIKTIEAIPVLLTYQMKQDPEAINKYLAERLDSPRIIVPKIKNQQLVTYNGTPVYISGITGVQIIVRNGVELYTDGKTDEYVKELVKLAELGARNMIDTDSEWFIMKTNRMGELKLVIDKAQNETLYQKLVDRLSDKIYGGISSYSNFQKTLESGFEAFCEISVYKQAKTLLQIFKFLKCTAETADLSEIGFGTRCGTILFSKNITDVDFRIINKSPAGLTVREFKV